MACETMKPKLTREERIAEINKAIASLNAKLMKRTVKPVVGPQGAITFKGWDDVDRNGIVDACAYRLIMKRGSALAIAEIEKAQQLAGRAVSKQALAAGVHSHDGGVTWGKH